MSKIIAHLDVWLRSLPGELGRCARLLGRPPRPRRHGHGEDSVFPLPSMSLVLPRRGRGRARCSAALPARRLVNLWILFLNYLHGGSMGTRCDWSPSAAQRRVHESLMTRARDFLRRSPAAAPRGEEVRAHVKMNDSAYLQHPAAIPLGAAAGIPGEAATCDVVESLRSTHPDLARVAEDPRACLLPQDAWPPPRRPYINVEPGYADLIQRAVEASLVEYTDEADMVWIDGQPRHSGAFAVPKDGAETRWIAPSELVNDIIDDEKVPPTLLPYLPQLATVTFPRGSRARVSKRDARHYFHSLRTAPRWRPFHALPPVRKGIGKRHCRLRSWPMGCKLSAGLAQAISNVAAAKAGLPPRRRLLPGQPTPGRAPIWGSIIDDLWVIHEEPPRGKSAADGAPAPEPLGDMGWATDMVEAWRSLGVHPHEGKQVDFGRNVEVQGALVSHLRPSMRLSPEKESLLLRGTLLTALCYRPARRTVERVMGKHAHAHGFRPCLRSLGQRLHAWVHAARTAEEPRLTNNEGCLIEMIMHALFLPHAAIDFCMPWSCRIEASDASPGGHGRAYTSVPEHVARAWGALAAHRGDYTTLLDLHQLNEPPVGASHMQKAVLPVDDYYWHEIPRPGFTRHIALEEYAAFNWSAEARMHRPHECGVRAVHLGDNATQVAAHAKGRSSSYKLNAFCRQDCAIQITSGNVLFEVWVPSKGNPADRPSSTYGVRARRAERAKQRALLAVEAPLADRHGDQRLPQDSEAPPALEMGSSVRGEKRVPRSLARMIPFVFIHQFSGPRREGDLQFWIEILGVAANFVVFACSIDILADPGFDLLGDELFSRLRAAAWGGWIDGYHGGPPCSTWSKARWAPNGPPPVRSRARPYGLPNLSAARQRECHKGSELFLRHLDVLDGVVSNGGSGTTEHPVDPGKPPFSSIFATPQYRAFQKRHAEAELVVTDQCMRGAATRKQTMVGGCLDNLFSLEAYCVHGPHKRPTASLLEDGSFTSKGTEAYPSTFYRDLAALFVRAHLRSERSVGQGLCPPPWQGAAGLLPSGLPRARSQDVATIWPLASDGGFPAFLAKARHSAEVHACS